MAKDDKGQPLTPLEQAAEDKVDFVRSVFSSDPPAAPPPPPPSPTPPQPASDVPSGYSHKEVLESKRGCAEALKTPGAIGTILVLIGVVLAGGFIYMGQDDKEECKSRQRRDGLQLIACVPPTSTTTSSASSESGSSGDADPPTEARPDPNVVTRSPADSRVIGGPASDGAFATPSSAPAGSKLFQGKSGDQVGFIAQDGQFRYVSLVQPGVGVGEGARPGLEIVWSDGDGIITEFGARTSGGNVNGRYGLNPYANGGTYLHGCALELGQTACKSSIPSTRAISNGDRVVIQVGEAGHLDETGDFTFEWWFVFQPS